MNIEKRVDQPLLFAKIKLHMTEAPECMVDVIFEGRPCKMIQVEQRTYDRALDQHFNPPCDIFFWFPDNDDIAVAPTAYVKSHKMDFGSSQSTVITEGVKSHFDVCVPVTVSSWSPMCQSHGCGTVHAPDCPAGRRL